MIKIYQLKMNAQDYFTSHGINADSIKKFGLLADSNKITIPIKDHDNNLLYNKYRNLNGSNKYEFDQGSHPSLFNISSINNSKYVIITEGEIDAIRLDQEGICAISSTGGANTFKEEWVKLLEGKKVFICYDSDEAGQKALQKIVPLFKSINIIHLPKNYKDICEYFTEHNKTEFKNIFNNSITKEEYLKTITPEEFNILSLSQLQEREYPEEQWIIDKILPSHGFTMFVGESGAGKSYIALDLVKSITNQSTFLDHFIVKQSVPILIIDKENGLRRIQKRTQEMQIHSDQVYLLEYAEIFDLTNEKFIKTVTQFIADKQIKVVILDSFVDFLVNSENDPVEISSMFNTFRTISNEISYVVLHHDSKPIPKVQRSALQRTRGSSNIVAQLDNQFYIEKTKNPKIINIEQGKSRDGEPVNKFAVEFLSDESGNMRGFHYLGQVNDQVKMIEQAQEFIYQYLSDNPMRSKEDLFSASEISLGITARTMQDAIQSLDQKGVIDFIKQKGHGNKRFYFLVSNTEGGDLDEQTDN